MRKEIKVGEVYWHRSMPQQRVVKGVQGGHVFYDAGNHVGYVTRGSFLRACPKRRLVTNDEMRKLKEKAAGMWEVHLDTVNGILEY